MAAALYVPLLLAVVSTTLAEIEMEFTKWPESVTAPVGDKVTFECKVRVPAERLVWRWRHLAEESQWQPVQENYQSNEVSTRLVVEMRRNTKDKYYQCVVWYGAVVLASVPARLTVAQLDLTRSVPEKRVITAPLRSPVALHCKPPASEPPAEISWFKEVEGTKQRVESTRGVLIIDTATPDSGGSFGCTATNALLGQTVDLPERVVLRVQHEGRSEPRFLEREDYVGIVNRDGVLTAPVRPNEDLFLVCGVVGTGVKVYWSRDNRPLPSKAKVSNDGTQLTVGSFKHDDAGIYTCSSGSLRRSWKVTALSPARWQGSMDNVNATEGNGARVSCGTPQGNPRPNVFWLLNGEPVNHDKRIRTTGSELYIEQVEKRHASIVQCFACNELGCAYDAALLQVFPMQISDQEYSVDMGKKIHHMSRPPKRHGKTSRKHSSKPVLEPPSRPNVTRMSDESVMITWSNGTKGLQIVFFKVQYIDATNKSNTSQWNTCNSDIPPHVHSYEITGLTPDRYYKFRISAVYSNQDNKQGRSTGRFHLQRGQYRGPRPPALTNATALSPSSIVVNWTYSIGNSVPADGFYIHYRDISSAGEYVKMAAAGDARSAILSHLSADTGYEVKVQSYTVQAPSEFTSILKCKTLRSASQPPRPPPPAVRSPAGAGAASPSALVTAGAAGAALLVILLTAVLLCRRAKRPARDKEKVSVPEGGSTNGYIPAKVPITITSNPMHGEGGESGVEMSFMHNNNTGSEDSTLSHSRKNGTSPRYV
ncbi:hypothetical protein JYU34_013291 [Plutella xylostella]|uniref:Interference hedgehog n=1 Tax=Plutella xylostella TaxID=51655 RepID=A0ABQ7QD55_PLUXY|nr:hypothetical protein JYU34_013291 [Plutella xylostella]